MVAETLEPPTLAELFHRYGPMPAKRIRLDRFPATEEDVDELRNTTRRLYELVDGVLLEKVMGLKESAIAVEISTAFKLFLRQHKLGFVAGEAGMMRLALGLVRIPDVSFVSWSQTPDRRLPDVPILDLHPDLAVDVLSESNTKREMEEKLENYFDSGASLVWLVDPTTRTVRVYTSVEESTTVDATGVLDGGTVLPGFELAAAQIFAELSSAE